MRSLLDQYAADKGKLPQSLDDLVTEHYLREIPKDPITDNKDWTVVTGDDPYSTEGSERSYRPAQFIGRHFDRRHAVR